MVYDSRRGVSVLFGGVTPAVNGYETDTWEYDETWTEVNTDHWPPGRTAHAMAYDSNRGQVVLLGGGSGGASGYRADTWEYGVFTQAVTAGFSASPFIGTAPLTVTFSDQSSGAVDSLHWDYGDGATSTTSALTHTHPYTQLGTYTVTLTVNGLGGTDAQTATIRVVSQTYTTITRVIIYTYDKLYRLTGADYSSGEAFAYAYDPVGNRTVQTRTLTSTTVITYVYDAANRLDYFYEDGVLTDLGWDANGNLRTQGTSVYTWDAANRLVSAEVDGVVSAYEYDGLDNRTAQTVGGVTTEYVLDIGGGLPEVIVATTSGTSTYYVQIQGQILAQQESEAWAYVLPDHLGSVRQLTNAGEQVTLAQSFDPFGVLFETSGSSESDFGYTGEWWDSEAALLYLRARYYNPGVGRFNSKDPLPGDELRPQSMNGWSYVGNTPINFTDPSGLLANPRYLGTVPNDFFFSHPYSPR
jgi:RHS repeat-associated protein